MADLTAHFETLADRYLRGSLAFDRQITLKGGAGRVLDRLMSFLISELNEDDFLIKSPAHRRCYDETLLTAILSLSQGHPDSLSGDGTGVRAAAPTVARRAEEYMWASLGDVVTIADLVRICGCSRRSLSATFRRTRGYSPMEFLTEQRLLAARQRLRQPRGDEIVSSIALDCGFGHLGRFADVYRKRFGEKPSETLRKAQGQR